jgi:phosphatidylglycerophosphate synthase
MQYMNKKQKLHAKRVQKWAIAFTASLLLWATLFALIMSNVIPFSRCAAWEGEPGVSHCDAPNWEGWSAFAIWVGVAAFVVAIASFIMLVVSHNASKGKR